MGALLIMLQPLGVQEVPVAEVQGQSAQQTEPQGLLILAVVAVVGDLPTQQVVQAVQVS